MLMSANRLGQSPGRSPTHREDAVINMEVGHF